VRDPFKIDGPTCLSFSTGRTSGYLLDRVVKANPPEVLRQNLVPLTCNTGREDEASLRFGDRIDRELLRPLGLRLVWLEYRPGSEFAIVDFDSLSRNGEPFEAVIAQRSGTLPNPRSRYCSSELKTRTMHRYLRSIGWDEWETLIGIRADEPRRVAKFRFNPHPETKSEYVRIPLADAFVTAKEVGDFWRSQPFDLELPNNNGKTMHGNCDLCFLKPSAQVFSLIAEKPERAVWWAKQEANARATADGRFFRIDRPSYAEMARFAADQRNIFDPNEEAISCFCGD
jgi:3'-phosphoadenosine 5'-phosphosulfate sulfotransferase (PAPS reductase)/FAD synthetase